MSTITGNTVVNCDGGIRVSSPHDGRINPVALPPDRSAEPSDTSAPPPATTHARTDSASGSTPRIGRAGARALAAVQGVGRMTMAEERTTRTYACLWCKFESQVTAFTHESRVCPRTNCGGTQEVLDDDPIEDGDREAVAVEHLQWLVAHWGKARVLEAVHQAAQG